MTSGSFQDPKPSFVKSHGHFYQRLNIARSLSYRYHDKHSFIDMVIEGDLFVTNVFRFSLTAKKMAIRYCLKKRYYSSSTSPDNQWELFRNRRHFVARSYHISHIIYPKGAILKMIHVCHSTWESFEIVGLGRLCSK